MVIRDQIRHLSVLVCIVGSAFSIVRWFFAGLIASKWIGLPEFDSQMHRLQNQSRNWGIAAVVLEIVAIVISMYPILRPPIPIQNKSLNDPKRWTEHWYIPAVFCIAGTVGLLIVYFLIVYTVEVVLLPNHP